MNRTQQRIVRRKQLQEYQLTDDELMFIFFKGAELAAPFQQPEPPVEAAQHLIDDNILVSHSDFVSLTKDGEYLRKHNLDYQNRIRDWFLKNHSSVSDL